MKVDANLLSPLPDSGTEAARVEAAGYDGVVSYEGPHDPFVPLILAAGSTERVELMTGIAVAFARSPMTLANIGYDLQLLSKGRFILGLGSQIKPHIEKRFSMPWSHPAARMRELILAVRAIWASWQDGVPLKFEGEFYRHTLMTPFFNPGPNPYGPPRIFLAGVGPGMTAVAGEVADGFLVHPFCSPVYLRETVWPALREGFARAGRSDEGFEVAWSVIVSDSADSVRPRLAFYGSTPAYRGVLSAHGWGDLQPSLNALSKRGAWGEMASLITDEMVSTFAVVGPASSLGTSLASRVGGGLVTRVSLDASGVGSGGGSSGWAGSVGAPAGIIDELHAVS